MNRKILFRGKLTSGRGWSYGNLNIRPNNITVITPFNGHIGVYGQVIPDTVGQYTGLNDTNGKEIFEGDIVHNKDVWGKYTGVIVFKMVGSWLIGTCFRDGQEKALLAIQLVFHRTMKLSETVMTIRNCWRNLEHSRNRHRV